MTSSFVLDRFPPVASLQPLYQEVLHATGQLLLQDSDPDTLCQAVFRVIRDPMRVNVYFHYLVVPDGTHMELASSGGNEYIRSIIGTPLNFGQAVCGTVAKTCTPMNVEDVQYRTDEMTGIIRGVGTRCYCCHPLILHGRVLGTLSFGSTERDEFTKDEVELFGLIAQQVTLATYRRQQQEHLLRMEQLATVGRMSASLAHEINNPLESLGSVLYLLREESMSDEGRELLQTAEEQVSRLAETSRRTLDAFRGKKQPAHLVDLSKLTRELAADISLPRGVHLVTHIEDGLTVKALPGELRQVLFNLILNAANYTPLDTPITLTVQRSGDRVEVRVKDKGPGIPEHARRNLFQPFYTTRGTSGTGLGLWLSREMIESYRGTLTFESNPDVRPGTEFVISLPRVFEDRVN